ncbi:MAG: elongation factor P 5-aminopentanone reductase [Deltaproteobacteria bacterium]
MKGRTVIITGASRGIGQETAKQFSNEGYNVLVNYNKSECEAIQLKEILRKNNEGVEIYKADVSKRIEVEKMVEYCLSRFGSIDVLINNAGIAQTKLFTDITEEDWKNMIDVNLSGTFNCSQSVLKHMISKKSGKIINVSSVWGMTGASCEVHYSAVKAGIIGLTKALAKELGPSNIQVNCVAPGVIKTDMLSEYSSQEIKEIEEEIPLKRLGKADEIASLITFLASEAADYITGQIISPNGGFVI